MYYTFHIDAAARTATIRMEGEFTGSDVVAVLQEILAHPRWRPGFATLWDVRDARSVRVRPEDLEALSEHAAELAASRGPGRTAIVATDPHVRLAGALLAMKSKVGSGREFLIFSHVELAQRWLAQKD